MSSSWALGPTNRTAQGVGLGGAGTQQRALLGSLGVQTGVQASHTVAGMGGPSQAAFSMHS